MDNKHHATTQSSRLGDSQKMLSRNLGWILNIRSEIFECSIIEMEWLANDTNPGRLTVSLVLGSGVRI